MKKIVSVILMSLLPAVAFANGLWDSLIWDQDCWDDACPAIPDTTPDPFNFTDQSGVALNTMVTSDGIVVSGIDAPASVLMSVCTSALCEYSINSGTFTSASGTVNNGDNVAVRITSSSAYSTTTGATLTIGGVSDTFSVTTMTDPTTLTVSYTGLAVNNYTVSFTDTSTGGEGSLTVTVDWKDGNVSTGNTGGTFTHTYSHASTYIIIYTVTDSQGNSAYKLIPVTTTEDPAIQKYDITAHVTDSSGAPIQGATVYLKKKAATGWVQIRYGYTDTSGTKTFADRAGNKDYKVIVYRSSVDFDGSKVGKQATVKSGAFTLTADTNVDIRQGTPATDGPISKPWKGDNGTEPAITITP
jgi:hypothetical protein